MPHGSEMYTLPANDKKRRENHKHRCIEYEPNFSDGYNFVKQGKLINFSLCFLSARYFILFSWSLHQDFDLIRLDQITFLSQCKAPEIWAAFSCMQCFHIFIPPAVRPTLLRQMDMGSLTDAQIWVLAVHTKGGGAGVRHKSWLWGTEKLSVTLPHQGI